MPITRVLTDFYLLYYCTIQLDILLHSPCPKVGDANSIQNIAKDLEQHHEEEPHEGERTVSPVHTDKKGTIITDPKDCFTYKVC